MYLLAYALTIAYSPNFSLPIAFTFMISQNFPPPNISHVQYPLLCGEAWRTLWVENFHSVVVMMMILCYHF